MSFYGAVRGAFRLLAVPMFRFRVDGAERIPARGATLVVAPHRSWLDPACVGGAVQRPVRFLMIDRLYSKPWARWFYRRLGAIPVRQGGAESVGALRAGLRALHEGGCVGIFPEGRVLPEGDLGRVHPGVALLAARTGATVVPMFIRGSARAWPHGRLYPGPAAVSVHVGHPIPVERGRGRDAVDRVRQEIEDALRALAAEVRSR